MNPAPGRGRRTKWLELAAIGFLDPLGAAVSLGLSSLLVVANSLRLTRVGRARAELRRVLTERYETGLADIDDPDLADQ